MTGWLDIGEIRDLLFLAAKPENRWAPEVLLSKVQATNWWRTNSESERQWVALSLTDPKEAESRIAHQADSIQEVFRTQYGINFPIGDMRFISENSLRWGWDQQTLNRVIQQWVPMGDWLRTNYGPMAAFQEHPELGQYLVDAYNQKWSKETLESKISVSSWYKTTSEPARQWVSMTLADPAEAQRRVEQMASDINALSTQYGIGLTSEEIQAIATKSLQFGWDSDYLQRYVRGEFDFLSGQELVGEAAITLNQLKTQANQWGIPLSDQATETWLEGIVQGIRNPEEFGLYLQEQAKSLFPTLSGAIDQGFTPDQYFDPYRQIASRTLGLNPADIVFSDPKWGRALAVPDEQGNRRPMSLDEWQSELRSNEIYGWKFTKEATDSAYELALNLGKVMGVRA